jgi:anhydro-N-acetylmuramic acid kinase
LCPMLHPHPRELIVSGIMTGNSLDAVDVASFKASINGDRVTHFQQVAFYSAPCSSELRDLVLTLKNRLKESKGNIRPDLADLLEHTSQQYHLDVNNAVTAARVALRNELGIDTDLLGFHGQTVGHNPPSIATAGQRPYTIQIVNGAALANTQRVVTISDFRSDDLLNGGEGAPFAPGFNALLVPTLGVTTAAFVNAGNTSNIAIINTATHDVRGWDCGPCNQFPDLLMREEMGVPLDKDGAIACSGVVQPELIRRLWDTAVLRDDRTNALEIRGPRSFDPQWYNLPPELRSSESPLPNRLRTTVAFSAYCVAHSIALAITYGLFPETIALFGGGWKNPALVSELKDLCSGRASYILAEHEQLFASLRTSMPHIEKIIRLSDDIGLPSNGMEAGIFAFAAIQRLLNKPFTQPSFTNCKSPTRCGVIHLPQSGEISTALKGYALRDETSLFKDPRLSRAAPSNY